MLQHDSKTMMMPPLPLNHLALICLLTLPRLILWLQRLLCCLLAPLPLAGLLCCLLAPLPLAGLLCCLLAPLPLAGLLNLPRPCFLGWNVLHHPKVVPHRTYAHPFLNSRNNRLFYSRRTEQRRRLVHPRLLRGQEPLLPGARRQRRLRGGVGGGGCHPHPASCWR